MPGYSSAMTVIQKRNVWPTLLHANHYCTYLHVIKFKSLSIFNSDIWSSWTKSVVICPQVDVPPPRTIPISPKKAKKFKYFIMKFILSSKF